MAIMKWYTCGDSGAGRLAPGGADGTVVMWEVVELGLFRPLDHSGPATGIPWIGRHGENAFDW